MNIKRKYKLFPKNIYVMAESPIGVSTNINLVESPIGVSTGRRSKQGDLGIALGSEI